jgi:hypothetical protein
MAQDAKVNEFRELQPTSIGGTVSRDAELPVRETGIGPTWNPGAANPPVS